MKTPRGPIAHRSPERRTFGTIFLFGRGSRLRNKVCGVGILVGLLLASVGVADTQKKSVGKEEKIMCGKKVCKKPPEEEVKKMLSDMQYRVTQKEATEPPFRNEYWDNKKDGIYVDVVTGEPLFSSTDKFESGTGWPSFTRPIEGIALTEKTDRKLFYSRTEVRSNIGDSHLGHVFSDGPQPTGLRYCINSASLRFVPKEKLKDEGYEEYLRLFKP